MMLSNYDVVITLTTINLWHLDSIKTKTVKIVDNCTTKKRKNCSCAIVKYFDSFSFIDCVT